MVAVAFRLTIEMGVIFFFRAIRIVRAGVRSVDDVGLTLDDAGVLAFGGVTGFGGGVFGDGAGLCMTDVSDFGLSFPILVFLVGGTDADDALEWLIETLSEEMIVGSWDDCDDVAGCPSDTRCGWR